MPGNIAAPQGHELLDYRKNILTIIVTAFGAWVGAGAAYFFGRENLSVAADSLLRMHETSAERFKQLPVRNLPRKPIPTPFKGGDPIENVRKVIDRKDRWFIPIIKDDGTLENVIHEDAVWVYIDRQAEASIKHADIVKKTIADVVKFIRDNEKYKDLDQIYVPVSLEDKIGQVHEAMVRKGVYLGIITDVKGRPSDFVTTEDMRLFLIGLP